MTSHATRRDARVIDGYRRGKRCRRHTVARVAHIRRRRMNCALRQSHATRRMTIHAGARHHLRMIHRKGGKRTWWHLMTGVTLITGSRMTDDFTGCNGAIVTANTGTDDLRMIDRWLGHRRPMRGEFLVTFFAIVTRQNMRRVFSAGGIAVMTADAVI